MECIFPQLTKSPRCCILHQVNVEVWFLRLLPEMFYLVKKERKRNRNVHPLLTLADIPVPLGKMSRMGTFLCFWDAGCRSEKGCAYERQTIILCMLNGTGNQRLQGKGEHWQEAFLQAHPPCQQLEGSQLSQLNPQRNVLPFGEIPDNRYTL